MRARDLCSSSDGSADLGKLRLFFFSSRLGFAKTLWLRCRRLIKGGSSKIATVGSEMERGIVS